jgi:hypothetical protein
MARATELANAMAEVAEGYGSLMAGSDLGRLMTEAEALATNDRALSFRRVARLKQDTLALRAQMLRLARLEARAQPFVGEALAREAIEALWKMPKARGELWELITRAEELVTQAQGLLQGRRGFWTAALLSTAAMFVVIQQALLVIKDWATMNPSEMALPVWRKFGIPAADIVAYKELLRNADLESQFNLVSLVVLGVVFVLGMIWALYSWKGKFHEHDE